MTQNEPASIELDVRKELRIAWYDGHESVYPLDYLRKACPCAACGTERQEEEQRKKEPKANPFKVLAKPVVSHIEALDLESVGNYAVRIEWNDGHSSGIYTFDYLRKVCPCAACSGTT